MVYPRNERHLMYLAHQGAIPQGGGVPPKYPEIGLGQWGDMGQPRLVHPDLHSLGVMKLIGLRSLPSDDGQSAGGVHLVPAGSLSPA